MSEDAVQGRIGTVVEAEQTIKVLSNEVVKLRAIVGKWYIELDALLTQENGQWVIDIVAKTGERGLRKRISQEQALYFAADPDTISNDLVKEILSEVLTEVMVQEYGPVVAKAIRNVATITSKSSL